ncbi:MAG: hypothetical protein PVF74_10610 [Anaerolineales bacterium]|jgi:predicted transcriptional regulator
MKTTTIHQCQCEICTQPGEHPEKELHHEMNLLISRFDEQQRRWYVGLEAKKVGHGGAQKLSQITGMNVDTIRRGRRELEEDLASRPSDRVRLPGAGRPTVEKKSQTSSKP